MIRARLLATVFIAGLSAVTLALPCVAQDSAAIFKEKCATCHGSDGFGKTAAGKKIGAPDLHAKEVVDLTDKEMFESIGRGTRHKNYPHSFLYTGLSESQVRGLVSYIRALQQKK